MPVLSSAVTVMLTALLPTARDTALSVTALPSTVYSLMEAKLSVSVGTKETELVG